MHFLYSVYYELTASTCFEHYLLIFRTCCINNYWYIVCVLCWLAATPGLEWMSLHSNPGSSQQYTHNIPIVVYAACPEDEQECSKHVEAVNSQ
jgi:hypothetical protein